MSGKVKTSQCLLTQSSRALEVTHTHRWAEVRTTLLEALLTGKATMAGMRGLQVEATSPTLTSPTTKERSRSTRSGRLSGESSRNLTRQWWLSPSSFSLPPLPRRRRATGRKRRRRETPLHLPPMMIAAQMTLVMMTKRNPKRSPRPRLKNKSKTNSQHPHPRKRKTYLTWEIKAPASRRQ